MSKDELTIIEHGLYQKPSVINPSDELLDLLTKLSNLPIATTEYEIHPMKLEDAIYDAKTFMDYYYDLKKVPYLSIRRVLGMQIHTIRNIDPFKLPLRSYNSDDVFSASLTEIITKKNHRIVFREINLPGIISEQTSASYIHELTHTQLDSLRGILKKYENLEVLSIFNELFHTSILDKDERILRLNDSRRISEMLVSAEELRNHHNQTSPMTKNDLLNCLKYLISDLKAYNLFITFYYATDKVKNEILDSIQAVFDSYLTVEELLMLYDVTLESSQDEKKLLKYFTR